MGKFLLTQQVYKSTGDVENATKFFGKYSEVSDFYLKVRELVIQNKKPRRVVLQGNVQKLGNSFQYLQY